MSNLRPASIFDLDDALIIDPAHVRVERLAPEHAGDLAIYRKAFKETGGRDYRIWTEYENRFLYFLAAKNLTHVAQLGSQGRKAVAGKAALTTHLETFDAGPDLQKWCRIHPRYANGAVAAHPFQHVAQYLRLMRACLVALKEIHRHDIVHGDVKENNICLFYQPYPYRPESGLPVQMDFAQLKLIDFAWSVSPHLPLEHPLPVGATDGVTYQAPMLKAALEEDRKSGHPAAVKKLDYRVDLYSLGHMAEAIVSIGDTGLIPPRGPAGFAAFAGAERLGQRLKMLGTAERRGTLPHDGLIAEIDGWLRDLPGPDRYLFWLSEPVSTMQAETHQKHQAITPITPLAVEAPFVLNSNPPPTQRHKKEVIILMLAVLVAALIIGIAFVVLNKRIARDNPYRPGEEFHDKFIGNNGFGPEMVVIPSGTFMRGSPTSEEGRDAIRERPYMEVTIAASFAMSKTPVTFDEWDACYKGGGCAGYFPKDDNWGRADRPVINVSWANANNYVKWLSTKTGKHYRLPSEAEWEYAARAKTTTARYWDNEIASGRAHCNGCGSNLDPKKTAPVKSFTPNGFGLHDMLGNVMQLTQDCWNENYEGAPVDGSARIDGACDKYRVLRGGSWDTKKTDLRAAVRYRIDPTKPTNGIGFRIARTLP